MTKYNSVFGVEKFTKPAFFLKAKTSQKFLRFGVGDFAERTKTDATTLVPDVVVHVSDVTTCLPDRVRCDDTDVHVIAAVFCEDDCTDEFAVKLVAKALGGVPAHTVKVL